MGDYYDKKIKLYSPDGENVIQSFRAPGCGAEPWCAVYQQDKFFVCYPEANRVMAFNNAGEYLYDIGSEESGDGQFSDPADIFRLFCPTLMSISHSPKKTLFYVFFLLLFKKRSISLSNQF